ncbi:MAG TPA: hypothetical protein VIC08_16080 [Cellvibrionaceae bacterium]
MKIQHTFKSILSPVFLVLPLLCTHAAADSWVDNIALSSEGIIGVSVKNTSANKSVNAVTLAPAGQNLSLSLTGVIDCANNAHVYQGILQFQSEQAWGKMNMGTDSANLPGALHSQTIVNNTPALTNGPNKQNISKNWHVPLAAVKQGNNAFDPVAIVQEGLQKFKAQGGSEVDFYRQNRSFSKDVSVSLLGSCGRPGKGPATWGVNGYVNTWMASTVISVMVNYQADPAVFALNAQMGGNAGPGGIQAQPKSPPAAPEGGFQSAYNPLVITEASLQAHTPNYSGQCPKDLSFTVRYKGGGKGMVRYHIVENGQTAHMSAPMPYNSTNGWRQHQFTFGILANAQTINQKVNRNFRLFFEVKEDGDADFDWNKISQLDSLNWSHTCQARAKVTPGGTTVAPNNTQNQHDRSTGKRAPNPTDSRR